MPKSDTIQVRSHHYILPNMYVIGYRAIGTNTAEITDYYILSVPKIYMPIYCRNFFTALLKYALA